MELRVDVPAESRELSSPVQAQARKGSANNHDNLEKLRMTTSLNKLAMILSQRRFWIFLGKWGLDLVESEVHHME